MKQKITGFFITVCCLPSKSAKAVYDKITKYRGKPIVQYLR